MSSSARIYRAQQATGEVKFSDIARLIDGKEYEWCIYDLWCIGSPIGWDSVQDLEQAVWKSSDGLCMDWFALCELLEGIDQIIEIFIIGRYRSFRTALANCNDELRDNISIRMVDSDYWEIQSENSALMEILKQEFVT